MYKFLTLESGVLLCRWDGPDLCLLLGVRGLLGLFLGLGCLADVAVREVDRGQNQKDDSGHHVCAIQVWLQIQLYVKFSRASEGLVERLMDVIPYSQIKDTRID